MLESLRLDTPEDSGTSFNIALSSFENWGHLVEQGRGLGQV